MIWKKIPYVKDAKLLKHYPEKTHHDYIDYIVVDQLKYSN